MFLLRFYLKDLIIYIQTYRIFYSMEIVTLSFIYFIIKGSRVETIHFKMVRQSQRSFIIGFYKNSFCSGN